MISKPISRQKWYAMPADSFDDKQPRSVGWAIVSESGKMIIHEGDREYIEQAVAEHNRLINMNMEAGYDSQGSEKLHRTATGPERIELPGSGAENT